RRVLFRSQEQITGRAAANAGAALALEADTLVVDRAGGHLHIECPVLVGQAPATGVILRHTQAHLLAGVGYRVLQEQRQIHFGIATGTSSRLALEATATEQILEKFREIRLIAEFGIKSTGVASAVWLAPIGLGFKTAALAVAPQLIVFCAFVRILEHFIGFGHFLEPLIGVIFLGDIRMIFTCQLAVSGFDGLVVGVGLDAEDVVVVLEFHVAAGGKKLQVA